MKGVIAVFQYEWPTSIHIINLVNALEEKHFEVILFTYKSSNHYFENENKISNNVAIHSIEDTRLNILQRILDKILLKVAKKTFFRKSISKKAIEFSTKKLFKKKDLILIGIEKKGLAWAGFTSNKVEGKLIYFSLELYETNPGWFNNIDFDHSRKLEIQFHNLAKATIIQDYLRACVLYKYNNYPKSKIIRVPISLRGRPETSKGKLIENNIRILYFGLIERRRNITQIIQAFEKFSLPSQLKLHGPAYDETYISYLKSHYPNKNITISTNLLKQHEISNLFKDAEIGICLYSNNIINDRLTAFSSEKIAYYFKNGIPIISFRNESYEMLFGEIKCGIMIDDYCDLENAVREIKDQYSLFSENALTAYNKYFNFDFNIEYLLDFISNDI